MGESLWLLHGATQDWEIWTRRNPDWFIKHSLQLWWFMATKPWRKTQPGKERCFAYLRTTCLPFLISCFFFVTVCWISLFIEKRAIRRGIDHQYVPSWSCDKFSYRLGIVNNQCDFAPLTFWFWPPLIGCHCPSSGYCSLDDTRSLVPFRNLNLSKNL